MPARWRRRRDLLLVLLAVTTGACDATAFLRVGNAFASVITGNLVLLGVSAVSTDRRLAVFAGCALGGYALGVLAGASRGRSGTKRQLWPASSTYVLAADLALLVVFAVGWEVSAADPDTAAKRGLLIAMAAAMGLQSTAVRRLGEMSTTYLTSTLTGLLERLITRRVSSGDTRSAGILLAALLGAAAATALLLYAPRWLPAIQLVPLAIVVLASRTLWGR